MEYDHGRRSTPHYYEMSPLDRAIYGFEKKAKEYHAKTKATLGETPEQRAKREKELSGALRHLQAQRLEVLAQVQVQTELEEYRAALKPSAEAGREERIELRAAMALEKHHPTNVLAKLMRADGRPQPGPRFSAHHIVQGIGKTRSAAVTRVNMHLVGIRVNDPDNGVYLPRTKADKGHWAMPNAPAHSEIHTYNYEDWVFRSTQNVRDEASFRGRLITIRGLLRDGQQDPSVTQSPIKR